MPKRNRTIMMWMLMLVIAASPMQVSLAQKAAPHDHDHLLACQDTNGHADLMQQMDQSGHCTSGHSDKCIDHPGCLAQLTFTSLQPVGPLALSSRAAQLLRYTRTQSEVLSHYPDSLTRPPNT